VNERIQLLIEQATTRIDPTAHDGACWDFDKEKFAELIVAECIAQCEQVATDADAMTNSKFVTDAGRMLHEGMWGGAKNCTAQIQTHFGVEE
jgi:hypothetical protein